MHKLQGGLVHSASGPRDAPVHLRVVGLHRHGQRHELVLKLSLLGAAAFGIAGELVQPVSQASQAWRLGPWRRPAVRRRGCEDCRLELVERCVAALERGLDCVELILEEAQRETSRVGHLEQALLEPRPPVEACELKRLGPGCASSLDVASGAHAASEPHAQEQSVPQKVGQPLRYHVRWGT